MLWMMSVCPFDSGILLGIIIRTGVLHMGGEKLLNSLLTYQDLLLMKQLI